MTTVYLLKWAFSTGIRVFDIQDEDIQEDRVWIKQRYEYHLRSDVALSEEEALNKLQDKVGAAIIREKKRHETSIKKLERLKTNLSQGVLPKITDN